MYCTYAVCLLIHHPSVNLNSLEAKYFWLWLKLLGTFSGEKLGQAMKGNNGRTNGITCRELMNVDIQQSFLVLILILWESHHYGFPLGVKVTTMSFFKIETTA